MTEQALPFPGQRVGAPEKTAPQTAPEKKSASPNFTPLRKAKEGLWWLVTGQPTTTMRLEDMSKKLAALTQQKAGIDAYRGRGGDAYHTQDVRLSENLGQQITELQTQIDALKRG